MSEFRREKRYQVTKLSNPNWNGSCVVVEDDWPEYEIVWKMIQDRIEGKPNIIEQLSAANQRIAELEKDYAVWREYTGKVNDRNIELEERIRVADAEIKRLQGWVDVLEQPKVWSQAEIEAVKGSGLEYSMYLAEESLLVHRVVEEVQALRRGVGVSYAINDDPVEKLAKKLPPVENVVSTLAMIKAAMQKQLLKEN